MPKGLRNFTFSFGAGGLTRFGGLSLFQQFCKSLHLRRLLQLYVRWPVYDHRDYHPVDLFMTHVFAIVAGLGRIENTQALIHNGLVPLLLGLDTFPHRDTLRTFLWRFEKTHLRSLESAHNRLRSELFKRLGLLYSATVDADTTTITVFGHQESVAVGYNRKYRGKRSYAPILSSEGQYGFSLGMELRPGNTHSSTGAWSFLKEQIEKLPSTIASSRIRLRLDGGFYDKAVLQKLDDQGLAYVVVAKMSKPLKKKILSAKYREYAPGWEVAQFSYPLAHWKKEHTFVAVRRPKALESEALRKNLFTFKDHTYHRALVTAHLDLQPESIYRFYCRRGFQELLLREFKDSYHMAQIPTHGHWANATFMEIILWAYDLVLAFQLLCMPNEFHAWNISTLRRDLWAIPAELVSHGSRNILRLPEKYPQPELWGKIQKSIGSLKPIS
jgi:hypothetical protein